ncbi:exodeoxyribonuclease VII small subunit [compost metagenome]
MKEQQLTYEQAYEELQQIIADIESGEISVDLLSEKVKRAAELIQLCKSKLTSTENDVQKILDDLKSTN